MKMIPKPDPRSLIPTDPRSLIPTDPRSLIPTDPRSLIPTDPRSLIPDPSLKKGSALLIVLGMLAFMVMSAVSFSIYMRQNRLPSSYLAQQVSAAMLAKCALAEAMHEIDHAIGDDPYPNDYNPFTQTWRFYEPTATKTQNPGEPGGHGFECCPFKDDEDQLYFNVWRNRVYVGGHLPTPKDNSTPLTNEELADGVPSDTTVATMPFEGLAYVPPPLVNTVRYWMRHSPSSQWKMLDYDSGRYCFTAVNVTDYFDINRIRAGTMRGSRADNRLSFAYRYEGSDGQSEDQRHKSEPSDYTKLTSFDDLITNGCNVATYGRLTSMADYNLVMRANPVFEAPFIKYLNENGANGYHDNDAYKEVVRRQTFITDSWHPGKASSDKVLTEGRNAWLFDGVEESVEKLLWNNDNKIWAILRDRLNVAEQAALYDYLDTDRTPISLAFPTMERVPMLTGLHIKFDDFKIELDKEEKDVTDPTKPEMQKTLYTWKIKALGESPKVNVSGSMVYPFPRSSGLDNDNKFGVQAIVKLFLSDTKLVTTRLSGYRPDSKNWAAEKMMHDTAKAWQTVVSDISEKDMDSDADAEGLVQLDPLEMEIDADALNGKEVYSLLKTQKLVDGVPQGDPLWELKTGELGDPIPYRSGEGVKTVKEVKQDTPLYLNAVCSVRIVDQTTQKTVDLVPATWSDDMSYNGFETPDPEAITEIVGVFGLGDPIIPVVSVDEVLNLNYEAFKAAAKNGQDADVAKPAVAELVIRCDDPRFNHAPENWYISPNGQANPSDWLTSAQARCKAQNPGRTRDVFQFVSDAGYLQSVGELQFLPKLGTFKKDGGKMFDPDCQYLKDPRWKTYRLKQESEGKAFFENASDTVDYTYGWKTHWCFGQQADWLVDGDDCDPYSWGIVDTRGGAAVSPYAAPDLFMVGLANTPYDWTIASSSIENQSWKQKDATEKLKEGLQNYCFNEYSTEAKLEWTKLKQIGAKMQQNIQQAANVGEWEEWSDWDDANFFGQSVAGLSDVDRKFLFSYWKNCFVDDQQLFLIFVRAEPAMSLGGGATSATAPSQLGARAVALVWRDPKAVYSKAQGTNDSASPHRMRILFYHQFE